MILITTFPHHMAHEPTSMKSLWHLTTPIALVSGFWGDDGERIEGWWWFHFSPLDPWNTMHT